MSNKRKVNANRVAAYALSGVMLASMIPYNVFASPDKALTAATTGEQKLELSHAKTPTPVGAPATDALSSATYYKKANWENKIKDKSRWPVGDNQRLVRVTTSDPVEMNDIDYDGNFVDANGRTVLRMVYKEKGAAATAVWYRAIFNFGELDQYIDYDKSYMVGVNVAGNEAKRGNLEPFNDRKERIVDLGVLRGDLTNQRKNLPINLVLKEGVTIEKLGKKNYIVQMRLADTKGERIYAYAPKGTSMDYSTYTKTTSVSLEDKVNRLFIKGGYQSDNTSATNQEFVMSEFIANPKQYKDEKNLGIIRTQYMGQRAGNAPSPTVGGQPIAFTQVFDANLLNYLKADDAGNVAYVNVLENSRLKSKWSHNFGIKKKDFNLSKDKKLAYLVIGTHGFQKDGVNKVEIPQHDQYSMISGFYITAIDYVVDKSKFEDTFAGRDELSGGNKTRKLNYSMISGWTNPNKDGWVIYEKKYEDGYVANEGESFIIDTTKDPTDSQIMIQIGNEDAIIRRQQGYYTYYVTGNKGIETIEKFADGIFKFDLREGATVKPGDKIKIFMPYTKDHNDPVNFLEIHNGTKLNEGGATLKLQKDRNINMHLYTDLPRGALFKLKYTLAKQNKKGETEGELVFTKPKGLGTFWQYKDNDKVLTGLPNTSILNSGGNFYINTKNLEPGKDIIVEAYDENGKEIVERKSWFKYRPLTKSQDNVKELTWTDHSDKSSILSINKSLYTPYQVLFTNDYVEGTDDFYKNPKVLPAKNDDFKKDTKEFVGYTKYDGGKVRTLYEEGKTGKLFAKVQADENEYDKDGNLVGDDVSKKITIPKDNIFDPHFAGNDKQYTAYEYKVDLTKMLPYHSDSKTETPLTLLKDMKFVSTASDGSSLPSDLYETRVRARVLFDANTGKFADNTKKVVKIVPDNTKFYGEEGYVANGFEGANVEANTGDKFPEAPTLTGNNFLGWVTEAGKTALGKNVVTADEFNKLPKEQIFTNETPITKHLVVYAVYSDETAVTFDANEGKFTDGKDTTTVKVDGGNVTKPADPTRTGYKFLGWADKKDATTPTEGILDNITTPKTVYAVWEKTDKTPLELKAPTPVEVKDTKSLTSDEIDKVKKAVAEANKDKGITEADVTVAEDGTVTVTKNGKTGTLAPKQTVKQKEVQNNFNPPKEPVPVEKIGQLTNEEIGKIKQAVKDANPDRNFKDEDITVKPDGTVEINQGGKVGTIPADKTVVQKDTILDLTAPEKTEVKDTTSLTQAEREKVAAAVKQKNNLADGDKVEVDSKGNVTVTTADGKQTGTLEAKDTVKPFTRDGKKLNPPANKVKVGDTNKLTEAEKQAVRDEVKKANPELGFTDDEIQVDPNGTVTVPMGKSEASIPGTETVEEATDADKTIKLAAPEKTKVVDKSHLTDEEKNAVIAAIKEANPSLKSEGYNIVVSDDGAVTVTQGAEPNQKVGQLSQADTVIEKLKAPTVEAVADGSVKVIPNNKESDTLEISFGDSTNPTKVTATKDADGNWKLADGTDSSIKIDKETGTVTIPASKLSKNEKVKAKEKAGKQVSPEATANSNDSTAPQAPTVKAEDDGSVKVTPPTDADTKKVTIAYKDQDGNSQTLVATKGNDGNWTLPAGTDTSITIDQATGVVTLPKDKIKAGEEVTAKAKDANDNESVAGEATPVNKADLKAEVDKENTTKADVKYTNASQDKQEAYDSALDKAKKALNDPDAKQKDVNDALQQLKEAEAALDGTATPAEKTTAPTITKPNAGDKEIKGTAPAGSDVTVTLPDGTEIKTKADQDGKWTAKLPEGKEIAENDEIKVVAKDGDKEPSTEVKETAGPKASEEKTTAPTITKPNAGDKEIKGTAPAGSDVTVTLPDGTEIKTKADQDGKWTAKLPEGKEIAENDEIKVVAKDGDKEPSTEVKETAGPKASEEKPTAPDVKVKNNGDITVTPPAGTDKIIINYTDPNGNLVSDIITKGTDGRWDIPAGSVLTKDSDGNIVIPANNVQPGTEVTATAEYPGGSKATGRVNTETNPQYPIYPGYDGYNGLPLWYFYGNFGSNNTKVEPKKEVKEVKERGHHEEYMYGYPDGTFRPNANITRAEAAAMISRLKGYSLNDTTAPEFKDSKVGWFKAAINAVFKNGLMKGYNDGNFRPNDKITRAEFAQMIKNIDKPNSAVATFKDVKGHWAEDAINQAFGNGRISGYPDGTFRPDAPITRAEAVKIANSLFERSVDNSGLKEKLENPTMISKFTDVNNTHWAFYEIMEATNNHEFERRENGKVAEDWLEIDKDKKH